MCNGIHHISEQDGYVVVATQTTADGVETLDVATFPVPADHGARVCYAYSDALELAWRVRAEAMAAGNKGYARIDVLYKDGCRGIL